jgi:hypothetical protein
MRRLIAITLLGIAVAGCRGIIPERGDLAPASEPASREGITYEAGPCFGSCPVYSFTVRPDGSGSFTGKRFTAVTGERSFTVTPDQYEAFAAALERYRPEGQRQYGYGPPQCEKVATDMASVTIDWRGGKPSRLYFYFGCDMDKNAAMAAALGNAPDLLPALEPLIGPRP